MPYSFALVNKVSKKFFDVERRYNYTTPKTFLELIKLYKNVLLTKRKATQVGAGGGAGGGRGGARRLPVRLALLPPAHLAVHVRAHTRPPHTQRVRAHTHTHANTHTHTHVPPRAPRAQDNMDRLENGLNKLYKVQGEVDLLVEAAKKVAVEVEEKVASANVFAEQVCACAGGAGYGEGGKDGAGNGLQLLTQAQEVRVP
jgi:hypothetical protein